MIIKITCPECGNERFGDSLEDFHCRDCWEHKLEEAEIRRMADAQPRPPLHELPAPVAATPARTRTRT